MPKVSLEKCLAGNHPLKPIFRVAGSLPDSEEVVRWCEICGCVVVDIDYDGRTKPGAIMTMRTPKTYNTTKITRENKS